MTKKTKQSRVCHKVTNTALTTFPLRIKWCVNEVLALWIMILHISYQTSFHIPWKSMYNLLTADTYCSGCITLLLHICLFFSPGVLMSSLPAAFVCFMVRQSWLSCVYVQWLMMKHLSWIGGSWKNRIKRNCLFVVILFGTFRLMIFKMPKHWLKMLYNINIILPLLLSVVISQSIAWNSRSCDVTMEAPTRGRPAP